MNTFQLKDVKTTPDIIHEYSDDLRFGNVPIVIDNGKLTSVFLLVQYLNKTFFAGSYQCRAGWANQDKPLLIFKNLIAKTRRERGKKVSFVAKFVSISSD